MAGIALLLLQRRRSGSIPRVRLILRVLKQLKSEGSINKCLSRPGNG